MNNNYFLYQCFIILSYTENGVFKVLLFRPSNYTHTSLRSESARRSELYGAVVNTLLDT